MIPEHEIIEQLMDEPDGRPVEQLTGALAPRTPQEVSRILEGLWRAGKVRFSSPVGASLEEWTVEELLRAGALPPAVRVFAIERGMTSVFPED